MNNRILKKLTNSSLPNEYLVGLKILECNKTDKFIDFTLLLEEFNGILSRQEISKTLDHLFDLGLISGEWIEFEKNNQLTPCRVYKINKEAELYFEKLLECM